MRKQAKAIAFLVTAAVLLTLMGCGQSAEEQNKAGEATRGEDAASVQPEETRPEPVTLKVMVRNGIPWSNGVQEDPVAKEIEKTTGVTVDWINLMNVSDTANYLRTLIASSDLPDIMPMSDLGVSAFYDADVVVPMDEYLEGHGKNILKNAPDLIKINRTLARNNDGKLYFVANDYNDKGISLDSVQQVPHIRYDLYKAIGAPSIATEDELLAALKQMVEKFPVADDGKKAYGMGLWFGDSWAWAMVEKVYYGSEGWQSVDGYNWINRNTGYDKKYGFLEPEEPRYKGLRFFNKAWKMGLVDPDTAVLKWAQYMEKAKAGRYYYGTDPWTTRDFYNPEAVKNGQPEKGFMPIYDWAEKSSKLSVFQKRDAGNDKYFITKNCKTPERAMDLLDFFYSEDGVRLLLNGIEGQHYEIVDGKPKLTASYVELRNKDKNAAIISTGIRKYNLCGLGLTVDDPKYPGRTFDYTYDAEEAVKAYGQLEKEYCADQGITYITQKFVEHADPFYSNLVLFTRPPMADNFNKIKNELDQFFAVEFFKIITAEDFEAAVKSAREKAAAMNYDEFTELGYKAFDETVAKLGLTQP